MKVAVRPLAAVRRRPVSGRLAAVATPLEEDEHGVSTLSEERRRGLRSSPIALMALVVSVNCYSFRLAMYERRHPSRMFDAD